MEAIFKRFYWLHLITWSGIFKFTPDSVILTQRFHKPDFTSSVHCHSVSTKYKLYDLKLMMEMRVPRENIISKGEISTTKILPFCSENNTLKVFLNLGILKNHYFSLSLFNLKNHYWHLFTNPWKSRLYYVSSAELSSLSVLLVQEANVKAAYTKHMTCGLW